MFGWGQLGQEKMLRLVGNGGSASAPKPPYRLTSGGCGMVGPTQLYQAECRLSALEVEPGSLMAFTVLPSSGTPSPLSPAYILKASPHWRMLFMHCVVFAFCLAPANTGNSNPARIAMMAITTSNSIRVNARRR